MRIEPNFKTIVFPEDCSMKEFMEFWKVNFTISLDVNTIDPKMKDWIYNHQHWFQIGKE